MEKSARELIREVKVFDSCWKDPTTILIGLLYLIEARRRVMKESNITTAINKSPLVSAWK